jgi:quercetin dioxygenase-like cupin family protein
MFQTLIALAAIGADPSSPVPIQEEPLHRVVFASKALRIFDVVLPPHATTLYHVHANDMAGVTLVPGPTRDEELGKPPRDDPADAPDDVWFEPHIQPAVHRVTNLGDSPIRMIGIELLTPRKRTGARATTDKAAGVILENDRVRVTRFSLRPGEKSEIRSHGSYVLVSLGQGRLRNVCGKAEQVVETAGFLCVAGDRRRHIANIGDAPIEFLEFELAG